MRGGIFDNLRGPKRRKQLAERDRAMDSRRGDALQPQQRDRLSRRSEPAKPVYGSSKHRIRHVRRAGHVERRPQRLGHRPVCSDIVQPAQHQRALALGPWHHLQRHLRHDRERAPGPRQELAQIVAGDVLHHPATGFKAVAEAGHRMRAQ